MTFFNWFDSSGEAQVSGYIWIYVLFTVLFTMVTIGLWWYFLIYKTSKAKKPVDEEAVPLV
jgi:cbb3-type cytochrome oxidase subunit 3